MIRSACQNRRYILSIGLLTSVFLYWLATGLVFAAVAPPPGYSVRIIHVKFHQGFQLESPQLLLSPELRNSVESIARLFSALPEPKLDELKAKGEWQSGETLPDLNRWFIIALKPDVNPTDFMEKLKRLQSVDTAQFAPLRAPPSATTPDFRGDQGYLDPAPAGIDARYSWTVPGGNGSGVKIYDIEYNWNQNHEDLSKALGVSYLLNPGDVAIDFFNDNNHGTAVLGVLVGDRDTKGVSGISWGSAVGLAPAETLLTGPGPNIASAIALVVADGLPGDVILIEQQTPVCGLPFGFFGPPEWIQSVFDVIKTAVANGFVVVETAGNGAVNLDQPACEGKFDRSVRDSGAIIVGAGRSPGSGFDRQRKSDSTYGSRVDIQAWGEGVMTTGSVLGLFYSDPDDPTDPNFFYTKSFAGTSSAGAIAAGAAANLQGITITQFGAPFSSTELRALLYQTGTPQLRNTAQNIGPRPNLKSAIAKLADVVNHLVSFVPIPSSIKTTSSTTGCPAGFVGKFNFDAKLAKKNSGDPLSALLAKVTKLTNGNLLQNADDGPGGLRAVLSIPNAGHFADGLLSTSESVNVPFSICLKDKRPFVFFVDVFGIEASNLNNSLVMK